MKIDEYILIEKEDLIAINKPSGLLTIPDRIGKDISLKKILQEKYKNIYTVHRLDRGTSGVVVFARTEEMHKHLSIQFESRETTKIYNGLVLGTPFETKGIIKEAIAEHPVKKGLMTINNKGKESITEYELLKKFRLYSWMQFHILTGRTHQIRVHMKFLGHPVVCDELYGNGKPVFISKIKNRYKLSQLEEEERPILNRLALHSAYLEFKGLHNDEYKLTAPIPKDLKATLNQLNKNIH